jgi:hypothetical protein
MGRFTTNMLRPELLRARGKHRQRLLRKLRATPPILREIFADDGVVAGVAERPATGVVVERVRSAASIRNAARFKTKPAMKCGVRPAANH